jgi:hypothetical protein
MCSFPVCTKERQIRSLYATQSSSFPSRSQFSVSQIPINRVLCDHDRRTEEEIRGRLLKCVTENGAQHTRPRLVARALRCGSRRDVGQSPHSPEAKR